MALGRIVDNCNGPSQSAESFCPVGSYSTEMTSCRNSNVPGQSAESFCPVGSYNNREVTTCQLPSFTEPPPGYPRVYTTNNGMYCNTPTPSYQMPAYNNGMNYQMYNHNTSLPNPVVGSLSQPPPVVNNQMQSYNYGMNYQLYNHSAPLQNPVMRSLSQPPPVINNQNSNVSGQSAESFCPVGSYNRDVTTCQMPNYNYGTNYQMYGHNTPLPNPVTTQPTLSQPPPVINNQQQNNCKVSTIVQVTEISPSPFLKPLAPPLKSILKKTKHSCGSIRSSPVRSSSEVFIKHRKRSSHDSYSSSREKRHKHRSDKKKSKKESRIWDFSHDKHHRHHMDYDYYKKSKKEVRMHIDREKPDNHGVENIANKKSNKEDVMEIDDDDEGPVQPQASNSNKECNSDMKPSSNTDNNTDTTLSGECVVIYDSGPSTSKSCRYIYDVGPSTSKAYKYIEYTDPSPSVECIDLDEANPSTNLDCIVIDDAEPSVCVANGNNDDTGPSTSQMECIDLNEANPSSSTSCRDSNDAGIIACATSKAHGFLDDAGLPTSVPCNDNIDPGPSASKGSLDNVGPSTSEACKGSTDADPSMSKAHGHPDDAPSTSREYGFLNNIGPSTSVACGDSIDASLSTSVACRDNINPGPSTSEEYRHLNDAGLSTNVTCKDSIDPCPMSKAYINLNDAGPSTNVPCRDITDHGPSSSKPYRYRDDSSPSTSGTCIDSNNAGSSTSGTCIGSNDADSSTSRTFIDSNDAGSSISGTCIDTYEAGSSTSGTCIDSNDAGPSMSVACLGNNAASTSMSIDDYDDDALSRSMSSIDNSDAGLSTSMTCVDNNDAGTSMSMTCLDNYVCGISTSVASIDFVAADQSSNMTSIDDVGPSTSLASNATSDFLENNESSSCEPRNPSSGNVEGEKAGQIEAPISHSLVPMDVGTHSTSSELSEKAGCSNLGKHEEEGSNDVSDKLRVFHVLDECGASDNEEDKLNGSDSEISDEEIEALLEEGLEKSGYKGKHPFSEIQEGDKTVRYTEKKMVTVEELGHNHFDLLPEGWILITHKSGMPVYLHKGSRVCTFSRPYYLGQGSARKHAVPLSAIPCLQYKRALEEEKRTEKENAQEPPVGQNGEMCLRTAKIETAEENKASQSLGPFTVQQYCKSLFRFKTEQRLHFFSWADRRRYAKAKKLEKQQQRPTFPDGTKLIKFPIQNPDDGPNAKPKGEWIMNPDGKSYICILHQYVQHALKKQPVYEFRALENPSTPYSATVVINGMKYGYGTGTSKKQAKLAAAKASLEILIPEMREKIRSDNSNQGKRSGVAVTPDDDEASLSIFDEVKIEDPRVAEFCAKTTEPSPYSILLTCLQRNFGLKDMPIDYKVNPLHRQANEFIMTVGKHTARVVCKNKKMESKEHHKPCYKFFTPHITSWGSLLRLYGNRSMRNVKEKKQEEQEITMLQSKASLNSPNYAILEKLKTEMIKLKDESKKRVPIGLFIPPNDVCLPSSGTELNKVDI